MLESLPYVIAMVGFLPTVFMVGFNISNKNKESNFVKKDKCIGYKDALNNKFDAMTEKITEVAIKVAKIQGILEQDDRE